MSKFERKVGLLVENKPINRTGVLNKILKQYNDMLQEFLRLITEVLWFIISSEKFDAYQLMQLYLILSVSKKAFILKLTFSIQMLGT